MHGLRADLDLTGFVGRELTQFAVGWNEVRFAFAPGYSIQVESSLAIESADGIVEVYDNVRDSAGKLVGLYGSPVTSSAGESDGTLSVTFANGWVCRFFDDSERYESYIVEIDSMLTVV